MWLQISLDLGVGSLKPKYTDSGRFGHALWHSPGTWCIARLKQISLTQAKRVSCDLSPSFSVAWPLEGVRAGHQFAPLIIAARFVCLLLVACL